MNDIAISLDTVWMLLAAMLVFFMQPGFALCEAGFTRSKNTANILMKNFVDFMFGSLLFWFVGFGFMFGSDGAGFIGMPNFGDLSFYKSDLPVEGFLIFETVFCATSATIVSGAMAERTKFSMYLVYSAVISLFIYPIEGHWTWGGGWLSELGFHDFAGSAIVHSVGGVLALIGAIALGPRLGKYAPDGKSRAIPGHNLTMAALGVFILWMGWFGFNPGSQLAASGEVNRTAISHVFLTTNLAAAAGGIATMFLTWIKYGKPSLSLTLNGVLALIGAIALGPRIGKYTADGKSRAIPGHNLTMAALGVFILWMGWFGFNPGSQLAASGEVNRVAISHVFLTTNLAAAAGGVATMFVTWCKYGKPSLSLTLNGILAGLVGITAGCDVVSPLGAVIIGLICGIVLVFAIEFIDRKLHIDDPVGASSVHGVCGILGTLLTGLLATDGGVFYGGGWHFFGVQCLGIAVIDLWAAATGFLLFFGIKKLHGLRVGKRVEEEGLDIYEHGESCYN